jgi:hypothetical protein
LCLVHGGSRTKRIGKLYDGAEAAALTAIKTTKSIGISPLEFSGRAEMP